MAITNELTAVKVTIKLNDGATASGGVKTKNINLGALNYEEWVTNTATADQKAANIVTALTAIMDRRLYELTRTNTYTLSEGE